MKRILFIQITIVIISLFSPFLLHAQVVFGSTDKPVSGALMDLKEADVANGNANSNRGLVLPRVKLTNKTNLFPMFETVPGGGIVNSDYTAALKPSEDAKHTGLTVYNLNKCDGFGTGVYVWNGSEWTPLGGVAELAVPEILLTASNSQWIDKNTLLITIPSGKDLRTFVPNHSLDVSWTPTSLTTSKTGVTNISAGGISFSSNPAAGWANPVSNPTTYAYSVNDMSDIITSDNPNISNPFRSRETIIKFTASDDECGAKGEVTARINQTNYRLTFKRDNASLNTSGYRLRNQSTKFTTKVNYYRFLMLPAYSGSNVTKYNEESNVRWYAAYEQKTAGILTPNIIGAAAIVPPKGGEERIDGTYVINSREPTYISSSTAENRHKTAGIMTYRDTAAVARFFPVEIHFVQCASKGFDHTNVFNAGTNDYSSSWDGKVVKHQDRDGNPFYSAEFGAAGRWMITNLATKTYDAGSGLEGTVLDVYNTIDLLDHDGGKKKYAYPMLDVSMVPTQTQAPGAHWDNADWSIKGNGWRPEEGILYNWYAATGRSYEDNSNNDEGAAGAIGYEPNKVQGICPKGWYLPSDREWNQLEEEIYNSLDKYASYDAIDLSIWAAHKATNPWNSAWNTLKANRGSSVEDGHIGHGAAMKDMCPPTASDENISAFSYMQGSKGYSKEYYSGGFNAIAAGRIKATKDISANIYEQRMIHVGRAYNANYWTSAQNTLGDAWLRDINVGNSYVNRTTFVKTHLLSVRCKKLP